MHLGMAWSIGGHLPFLSFYLFGYSLNGCSSAEPIATLLDKIILTLSTTIAISIAYFYAVFLPLA